MIRILASALLALSLTAAGAFATSLYADLAETDGLWHKRVSNVPFTGEVDEGIAQGAFKNGKREGPFVWYHVNGQLGQKGEYKNGEREGLWVEYYDYGWLWYKGEYKNGKREGPWLWHDEDGNKVQPLSGTYRNGEKISD
mgnify:CR=1 FL=1